MVTRDKKDKNITKQEKRKRRNEVRKDLKDERITKHTDSNTHNSKNKTKITS